MAVQNQLAKSKQRLGLSAYLTQDAVKNQINNIIGGKDGQRFITSIVSAVNANPALKECTNQSILSGALLGESLKLSPSPQLGQYYLVPFNNNREGVKEAQFQLGYKGYIQLAIRSGQYKKINVLAIKEGELEYFDPLNEDIKVNLIPDFEEREKAETIGYYAMFEYINGFRKAIYWSKAQMEAHAITYSAGYKAKKGYTFWEKNFDAMAYKTMLRQLISKWGIMSVELQTAFEQDYVPEETADYVETEPPTLAPVTDAPEITEETEEAESEPEEVKPEPIKAKATRAKTRVSLDDL